MNNTPKQTYSKLYSEMNVQYYHQHYLMASYILNYTTKKKIYFFFFGGWGWVGGGWVCLLFCGVIYLFIYLLICVCGFLFSFLVQICNIKYYTLNTLS